MVYGSGEGDRDMRTTLYVHESVDAAKPGWVWVCVQHEAGLWGRIIQTTKASLTSTDKADATYCGVATMASEGIDVDCVQYGWPKCEPETKPSYPAESPGVTITAEFAAMKARAERAEAEVNRWHEWADATLDLVSGRAIPATDKQNAITLKIQALKDRTRTMPQELATTKTELAAARGLVRGLENDRDNWHTEAKRLREERKAMKATLADLAR